MLRIDAELVPRETHENRQGQDLVTKGSPTRSKTIGCDFCTDFHNVPSTSKSLFRLLSGLPNRLLLVS